MPHYSKLTAKQVIAVQLIANGMTRSVVASQLNVDPGTLSRWRRAPFFQQELSRQLQQSERECVDSFRAIKSLAVERLEGLLNSQNQTIALKAVDLVLSKTELRERPIDPYSEREKEQWNAILEEMYPKLSKA